MSIDDSMGLLEEYVQWAAVQKARTADTTPDAFMEDRLKEVALDRIEQAMAYINYCNDNGTFLVSSTSLRKILEDGHDFKSELESGSGDNIFPAGEEPEQEHTEPGGV